MRFPTYILLLSLTGCAAALALHIPDLLLLAGPCAIASLWLLLRAPPRGKAVQHIVVDGSNVMHWRDNTASLETLREVLGRLATEGYTSGAIFDANAGYLLTGRYLDDRPLARLLGLPADRVVVVDKGSPADLTILAAARDLGAQVVTNDRYRDWVEEFPEIEIQGHLICGGYRAGKLWLNLPGKVSTRSIA